MELVAVELVVVVNLVAVELVAVELEDHIYISNLHKAPIYQQLT